jgi:ATP-binding cassette, subfamily B, bacterial CvaB/MchF/RaxB
MNQMLISHTNPDRLLNFGGGRRLPIIIQTEVAECGLACLGMIAGYYGFDTDIMNLRRRYSMSSKGTNLKNIMSMASSMHLASRALRVDIDELHKVQFPCVLHWGLNHFVVLKAITKKKYILHDPAFGERALSISEFGDGFTGVVLEITPTHEFIKGEEKSTLKLSHFWSNIIGLKRSLSNIFLLSLLLQLFALAAPFYMQTMVDDVLLRKDTNLLMVLALGFGLLMLIQTFTTMLREVVILHVANRLGMQMSANLFRHLIRLPMDYFSKRHMGDIVSRFGSLSRIRELLTHGIVAAIIDGIMGIVTLIAMFFYSVKLASIVIAVVILYGLLRWAFYQPFKQLAEESLLIGAKESSHFMESIRAIQTIKIFQHESYRQNQWQNRLADSINKNLSTARWGMFYGTINSFLFGAENIIVTYIAATSVMDSTLSLGMLYAFMSYKSRFIGAMDSLIAKWIELKMLDVHLTRLADIAFTPAEKVDDHINIETDIGNKQRDQNGNLPALQTQPLKKIIGKIEVRNLAYRYSESEPYIFKDLNFVIYPEETVAITGVSGCGKTTLLKCLMGLIEPSDGDIFIDDQNIKHISHYRSQIAGVMQDDQLLSGDIAENISCFSPQLNMEKVEMCAHLACIHAEIMNMPMQFHTLVGDMGSSLSGGQKQRLILARALYREPRILFMDEATSHLDVNNESMVNHNIQQLNITRVFIAHRPETIRMANRIIDLGHAIAN